MKLDPPAEPDLVKIEVIPSERVLQHGASRQQIIVNGHVVGTAGRGSNDRPSSTSTKPRLTLVAAMKPAAGIPMRHARRPANRFPRLPDGTAKRAAQAS